MNYASTSNIREVIKFYNLGDKTFETDFCYLLSCEKTENKIVVMGQIFINLLKPKYYNREDVQNPGSSLLREQSLSMGETGAEGNGQGYEIFLQVMTGVFHYSSWGMKFIAHTSVKILFLNSVL